MASNFHLAYLQDLRPVIEWSGYLELPMLEATLFAFVLAHMPPYAAEGCNARGGCDIPTVITTDQRPAGPMPGTHTIGWAPPDRPRVIFVSSALKKGSPEWEEVVAHEMTHKVQQQLNKYPGYTLGNPCHKYLAEKEAYEVGEARLAMYNLVRKQINKNIEFYQLKCDAARNAGLIK